MKAKIYVTFAVIFLLSGCAMEPEPVVYASELSTQNAETKLAEAAVSVSQSLAKMARVERAVHPKSNFPPPSNPGSIRMTQLTTIDWSGPIESLLKKIAKASHYKVRVIGRAPAIPILVSITATNAPLADVLRDARYQCSTKADIVVYPATHVLELRYKVL